MTTPLNPDQKIILSRFVGGGVCRHQALLGGYLLERLKKDGIARGNVSVDRNVVPDKGGHAWVRYESSNGTVYIIDAAHSVIGKLEKISQEENRWFYERPSDKNKVRKFVKGVYNRYFK